MESSHDMRRRVAEAAEGRRRESGVSSVASPNSSFNLRFDSPSPAPRPSPRRSISPFAAVTNPLSNQPSPPANQPSFNLRSDSPPAARPSPHPSTSPSAADFTSPPSSQPLPSVPISENTHSIQHTTPSIQISVTLSE